jgi:hypothetical protein
MALVLVLACKVLGCHIGCYREVLHRGVQILIKNKLQDLSVNRKMNLLSLINPSLAHVLL